MSELICIPKDTSKESIATIYRDIPTDVKLSLIDLCFQYCRHGDVLISALDGKIQRSPDISLEQLYQESDPFYCVNP